MKLYDKIGAGDVYFIAEMSANHGGSLEQALEIVRAAKRAGADCIKVQTYTADTMTLDCDSDGFRIGGDLWKGYTLYNLYKEASLPWEWHGPIRDEAEKVGLDFLSTPFDKTSVDFLEELGVEMYKIASFELTDTPLLKYAAQKQKPVLLSTGLASLQEISVAVQTVLDTGNTKLALLKCVSEYPAKKEDMNLETISDLRRRFSLDIGFSDHSMGSAAPVVAALLGARVIEKHFCLTRGGKGLDCAFSMEPEEFAQMVRAVNDAMVIRGGITYDLSEAEMENLNLRRSIFAVEDIAAGEPFTERNIRLLRPAVGLPPSFYETLLGVPCARDIKKGTPLAEEHLSL